VITLKPRIYELNKESAVKLHISKVGKILKMRETLLFFRILATETGKIPKSWTQKDPLVSHVFK
jgi:hypothetical protein